AGVTQAWRAGRGGQPACAGAHGRRGAAAGGGGTTGEGAAVTEIRINRDELVELTLSLCNIESPAGQEARVGEFVFDWMRREGFAPRRIGMFPDRFNVLGILPGRGDGYSLICNSH